jgi:uracil-DNA glycosylase family 4
MEFAELLEATIRHLEGEKARGVKHLTLSPDLLKPLRQPMSAHQLKGRTPENAEAGAPAPQSAREPVVARRPEPAPPQPAPRRPERSREEKEAAMAALKDKALGCALCSHLAATRRNVVFGVGNIHTELMFVGEAPGMDEDLQGEPFVGRAGELLDKIIVAMGLQRESIYIGNVLKCRPDTPGQASGNRKPTPMEMSTCLPFLAAQIDIIHPKVIVGLGATAVEGLFGKSQIGITRLRGRWMDYQGIPVMPTFHPSYLLRTTGTTEKRKVWEDMLAVMERLGMSISEKQRGFFQRR